MVNGIKGLQEIQQAQDHQAAVGDRINEVIEGSQDNRFGQMALPVGGLLAQQQAIPDKVGCKLFVDDLLEQFGYKRLTCDKSLVSYIGLIKPWLFESWIY